MTGLLSALSGQFSKSLLLSTLLPVVVFVLLVLVLVMPQIPSTVPVVHWVQGLDSEWKLAAVTLAVVLLTALLHNLNGPVIRFYEGYPWCDSSVGRRRIRAHRQRMVSMLAQWRGLWTLLRDDEAGRHPEYEKAVDHWNDLGRALNTQYPDEPGAVLPTRLGNVIRSFESYPWRQYKMRAITLWPRLVARLDAAYAPQIDDAKSSVDFMLNGSLLCGVLAVLVAVVHLAFPVDLSSARVFVPLLLQVTLFGGLAYGFYLAAIPRAQSWGIAVKGAFDLFRGDLLEALGYRYQPESLEEERLLWETISNRLIFSDLAIDPLPAYMPLKSPATGVRGMPKDVKLEIVRGMSHPANGNLMVTVQIRNLDPARKATAISLTDTVPDGWAYEWGSAGSSAGAVEVSGVNPYRFRIGDLDPGAAALVTYSAIPAHPPTNP
ncbi:MAG TPA: hypothetical protein VGG03_23795 [Thermoanaerobaculia bacterium]